ncbi:hypothetical protein [Paenarthrobacter sp. CM16]|uniref:hypothetical protein n=1 Tax=Paenarthrobacter sp. CM16 TaxID=2738447 RepID=UPI001C12DDFA|nr:hypothetical protein [Paenarthrobacter sp. CM16]
MAEAGNNQPEPLSLSEQEQIRGLKVALKESEISVEELWLKYFSIGGSIGEYEVDAYVETSFPLPPLERDLLAHAANELIDELPARSKAPYADGNPTPGVPDSRNNIDNRGHHAD